MQIRDVVIVLKGKEKNQLFIIVKEEGGYFYIADGKRVKKDKPKKKNCKHIQKASKFSFQGDLSVSDEKINAEIRKFLKTEKERICQKTM